ncbi:MAG: RelA/SpoT family protein [Dysgonamonadaceae bacterium]|jgi:GTP pyrophosphokinase|nr:RelA/SpoT family protein [Dysgonamonadaceae bacterium]
MIQTEFEKLLQSYANSNHRQKFELIHKAFNFANQAHRGVRRLDGDPYIMHPLAVAMIVCEEIGLGSTSICSALLHDVVEDADYTVDDIRNVFGDKIALIVEGLTKISGGIFAEASAQAENMRKLLLTMSSDIRVILIKIADRLHNMRTLGAMLPAKQYKIAGETMFLYAPMAHRLGLFAIKTELEDLSFKYEHPDEYKQITLKLQSTATNREKIYEHFAQPLREKLNEMLFKYDMKARVKSVYSIWNKMKTKDIQFEDIYDIFAVRIVFESVPGMDEKKQCWDIYSAITDLYKLRPDRIRDWISNPKANGYQALHVTVMGPDGQWIEVQIRSSRMDEIDEKGFAAHWKYKEHNVEEETELDKWIKTIQALLEEPSPNAMDFLDNIKLNLYANEIFVFTPKGDIKTLPQNATALDFAYELHSNIGNHCIGAKVNHKLVPLSQRLSSGDQVEILTSRAQLPSSDWLNFVTTGKARTKIEVTLRKQRRELIKIGETKLFDWLKKSGIEPTQQVLDRISKAYEFPKKDDLYYAIAEELVELPENPRKVLKEKSDNIFVRYVKQAFGSISKQDELPNASAKSSVDLSTIDRKKTHILEERAFDKNYTIAECCRPIPGDEVFGFIKDNGQLDIHKRACKIGLKLKANFGDRIVSCEWARNNMFSFLSTIEVQGIDRLGILNEITKTISTDFNVNIHKLSIESKAGMFFGLLEVSVHDVNDINQLCRQIQKIKGVKNVNRVDD